MANKSRKLEFEVRSTDSDRKTIDAVRETISLSEDLQNAIAKKYPGVKVEISRKEGLPIHAIVQHVIVSIDWHAVAKGVETAIAQFATTQFLTLAKDRVRNIFASPTADPNNETKPAKKSTPARKDASPKKPAAKNSSPTPKPTPKKSSGKSKESGQR
jgi:hypothetical protein